jgi:two-component system sensor histidine kinase ChiS
MDYTMIGDTVNASQRLESMTKNYQVGMLVSDEVKEKVEEETAVRFIDFTYVKGKKAPIRVYEVYEYEPDEIKEMKIRIQKFFEEAFEAYLDGSFKEALKLYRKLIKDVGMHRYIQGLCADPVLNVFSDRCEQLAVKADKGLFDMEEWDVVYRH